MANILITEEQAQRLLSARSATSYSRKGIKKAVMREIHAKYPIIGRRKIVLFVENPDNPLYRVVRDKATRLPIDDGVKVEPVAVKAPAKKAAPAAKKVAVKAPAKKVAVKAPAKKAAPAAKKAAPAAKKVAVKAPAKKAAPAAKKVAVKAPAKKAAPAAKKVAVKAPAKKASKK